MITIEQVLEVLKKDRNFRDIIDQDNYYYSWTGMTFDHLSYDSRDITPSTLFFAKGAGFKLEFLESAVQAGLGFYVAEKDYQVGIPAILVSDIKQAMSLVAQAFYQHPQDKLKLLAFTGTKGKTTASYFAFNILKQSHKPAILSSCSLITSVTGTAYCFTTFPVLFSFCPLLELIEVGVKSCLSALLSDILINDTTFKPIEVASDSKISFSY